MLIIDAFEVKLVEAELFTNRYLFQVSWNLLDTSTLVLVALALFFRIAALLEETGSQGSSDSERAELEGPAFMAQLFLASTAHLVP